MLLDYNFFIVKLKVTINTHEIRKCPRGEIGRHKGLKILAIYGVPVRVWPRAPLNVKATHTF